MTIPNTKLPDYISRIENLEAQRYDLKLDIDEIYSEAKEDGYDVPALREIVRENRQDQEKRQDRERKKAEYRAQLDMFPDAKSTIVVEDEDKTPPFVGVHAAGM